MSWGLQYLIALAALLVLAPMFAWVAKRFGSKAKGGLMLACVMLGLGDVLDQPAKHATEATESEKAPSENGEPPLA
jgi:hypothetical protein